MRFVHYYPAAMGDSGVTVALWGWASALSAAGFEVLVLHGADDPGQQHTPESFVTTRHGPVQHRPIAHRGRGRLLWHPVDLARHLRDGDVLVLHEGWVSSNLVAALSAARAGFPYILVPHGVYEPAWRRYLRPPHAIREAIERRVLERAAVVHLFFHSEAASIMALAPAAKIVVAPTGTRIPQERWRGGGGYLAWVGRYDPIHKGLDVLIDAVSTIPPDRRPTIRLRGYDYRGGLARLAALLERRPGMDRSIEVGGPISGVEKRRFLLEADGYILPSRWESHSVALLEVLSLGIPSIVSDTLHIAPLLRRYDAAVLATPDAPSLARALTELDGAAAVGPRGRAMVAAEFSWDRVVLDLVRQLETVGLKR
jgi:glycosyltransferase involved in cell wall biosynthesis